MLGSYGLISLGRAPEFLLLGSLERPNKGAGGGGGVEARLGGGGGSNTGGGGTGTGCGRPPVWGVMYGGGGRG